MTERPWQVWLSRPHRPPRITGTFSTQALAETARDEKQARRDEHAKRWPQDAGTYMVTRRG